MATFEKAVTEWTDTINEWYNISADESEVRHAFGLLKEYRDSQDEPNDIPYIETFFHGPGKMPGGKPIWRTHLDTVDREHLAGYVEHIREGNQ